MTTNKEQIKKKIYEKLPDVFPKLLKTVIMHIVMMIYHISMPPWVTAIRVKKELKSYKNTNKKSVDEAVETNRKMNRRRQHLNRRRARW